MKLVLRPVDTWFFRDSTPFTQDATPQQGVASVFPPYPSTVVGAIRAEFARRKGWNGRGRWDPKLDSLLGDGPENLGALHYSGPFLLWKNTRMFPMPLHLLGAIHSSHALGREHSGNETWRPEAWIIPGKPVVCDLGSAVVLPQVAADDETAQRTQGQGYWVSQDGLESIVRGEIPGPESIRAEHELWTHEPRVGIMRDVKTRAVKEGALYSTRHVRLKTGVGLGMEIVGWPEKYPQPTGLLTIGGESRLAAYEEWEPEKPLRFDRAESKDGRVAVIVLTPLFLEYQAFLGMCDLPEGLRVICAVADRPGRIGGWDSRVKSPLPLRNAIMPGSVLFCEIRDHERFTALSANGLIGLGNSQQGGFGLCALGSIPSSLGDVR